MDILDKVEELLTRIETRPYMREKLVDEVKFLFSVIKLSLEPFSDEPYMTSLIKRYQACIIRFNRIKL